MKSSAILTLLCALILVSFLAALAIGAVTIPAHEVMTALWQYDAQNLLHKIVVELRLPRAILALTAGAGLALAGMMLQTVTRNPLADPYLFGISSGASFGVVVLFAVTGLHTGLWLSGAAFIGSLLAVGMLLLLAASTRNPRVETLLLAGVALSFLFSALTSLLLYWCDPEAISAILFWSLGSFSRAAWSWLWLPCLTVGLVAVVLLLLRRPLNALLLGDEGATTLGVNVPKLRITVLLLSSLVTAVLVAGCGGIGFVGLMIPHMVRFFLSQAKVIGVLATALVGGLFMLWVDIAARTLLDNQELPIGVITSSIGSVFFLALLLLKNRGTRS